MEDKRKLLDISDDLMALTIHRPWVWAIFEGYKRVENRSWSTNHRGLLAVHAGRSPDSDQRAIRTFQKLNIEYPEHFLSGQIVGTVEVSEVLSLEKYLEKYGDDPMNREFAVGPYCWVLTSPVKYRPITCPGNFQIWNVKKMLLRYEC